MITYKKTNPLHTIRYSYFRLKYLSLAMAASVSPADLPRALLNVPVIFFQFLDRLGPVLSALDDIERACRKWMHHKPTTASWMNLIAVAIGMVLWVCRGVVSWCGVVWCGADLLT